MSLFSKFPLWMVLFILSLLQISARGATFAESEVVFQNGSIHFQATKSSAKFTFSDDLGSRSLEIKKCNQKIIESFWEEIKKSMNSLQRITSKEPIVGVKPWIKYEGIKFQILEFDPQLRFFNKVSNNSHVLFSESFKLCKNK